MACRPSTTGRVVIRILLIGRTADTFAARLAAYTDAAEFDVAKLPAAGVRQLEQTPPDAVVVLEDNGPERLHALVDAIKKRPLGALTPVVVASNDALPDADRKALDVAAWIDLHAPESLVLKTLAELLGIDPRELVKTPFHEHKTTAPKTYEPRPEASPKRVETPQFLLEEIDEPTGPRRLSPQDIFPKRFSGGISDELDESELRRKLRSVRHEDYFAILEIPRGAETPAIRDAFHKITARFDQNRISFDLQHRYHTEIQEIRDAFEDAWAVLGDSKLRADYLEHTTRR